MVPRQNHESGMEIKEKNIAGQSDKRRQSYQLSNRNVIVCINFFDFGGEGYKKTLNQSVLCGHIIKKEFHFFKLAIYNIICVQHEIEKNKQGNISNYYICFLLKI